MIDTIVFDIGNVLLDFDYMKQFHRLFDEETANAIADVTVRKLENWIELDRGVLSYEEAVNRMIQDAPRLAKEIPLAVQELYSHVEAYGYATQWVKSLKDKGYRLYVLSNYGEKPFAESKKNMPFLQYMDGLLISYEIRDVKPSAAIYRALCDKFQIDPGKAVFIDDSPVNIAGAKDFGMHTIHFTGYADAIAQLKALPMAYS